MLNHKFFDIIRSPIITEKSLIASESLGKYTFLVHSSSTKDSVKKAVESIFSVKVVKVNIINTKGKVKRFKGIIGKRNDRKKAIVTLAEGSKIDYSGRIA